MRLSPYRITMWLIDDVMVIFVCLFTWWFDSNYGAAFGTETGGLEFVSTITHVLQANQLTTCASHPNNQMC